MPSECIRRASPGTQSWQKITDLVEGDLQGLAHRAVEAEKSHHLPSASWRQEARVQFIVIREPMVQTPEMTGDAPAQAMGQGEGGESSPSSALPRPSTGALIWAPQTVAGQVDTQN